MLCAVTDFFSQMSQNLMNINDDVPRPCLATTRR